MRKKTLLNNNQWLLKTFRINNDVMNLYNYLIFYGAAHCISKDTLFDIIANYSLDYIENNSPKLKYGCVNEKRVVKGFSLTVETFERINEYFVQNKKAVKKGEYIEALIIIYALNHLDENEIENLIHEKIKHIEIIL